MSLEGICMENEAIKKHVLSLWQKDQTLYELEEHGHLPYLNLGRLYASKGMLIHAVRELEEALLISPHQPTCVAALQYINKLLN